MSMWRWLIAASSAAIYCRLTAAASDACPFTMSPRYDLPVAAGDWSYRLVAVGLSRPRSILFDTNGSLLVVDSGVGIVRLTLDDRGGTCLAVKDKKTLISSKEVQFVVQSS